MPQLKPGNSQNDDGQPNLPIPGQEPADELSDYLDHPLEGDEVVDETTPPATKVTPPAESVEERLTKALSTIENLSNEVRNLRGERISDTRQPVTPAPQQEFETVLGVRLPKEREKRPVRLSQEDLIKMKWNEDPTIALETLGNVLVNYVLGVVPAIVSEGVQTHLNEQTTTGDRMRRYHERFPDLVEYADLGQLVERRLRAEGIHERFRGDEYLNQVGTETRKRIAQMRGQSLEEYESGLKSSAATEPPARAPRSRTVTPRTITSPQLTRTSQARSDAQAREMDDLMQ